MSYILEALKKSDKKRQQEDSASVLLKNHPLPPLLTKENERGNLLITIGIIALLLIGFITYYFLTGDKVAPLPERQPAKETPSLPPQFQPEITKETPIPVVHPVKKKVIVANFDPGPTTIIEPQPLIILESFKSPELSQLDDQTPYLEELSSEFQDSVPKYKLAGHAFSPEPQLRLIMINNKIVREGEILEKGFMLDEITRDGIILSKDAERFRLKAN